MKKHHYWLFIGIITLLGVVPTFFLSDADSVPPMGANAIEEHLHGAAFRRIHRPLLAVVDQDDIRLRDRIIADSALRAQPDLCTDNLQYFYVRYDGSVPRAYGNGNTILVNGNILKGKIESIKIESLREVLALIGHECGHVADLGGLRGDRTSGRSAFLDGRMPVYNNDPSVEFYQISWLNHNTKRPEARKADFISGYAKTNPFEDFAEMYVAVLLQRTMVEERARNNKIIARKLAFMDKYVFKGAKSVATGMAKAYPIPWDITLLPFKWHPESARRQRVAVR